MNQHSTFRALWFRDWHLMKSWVLSFGLICIAGPVLNWIESCTTYVSQDKLSAAMQSIYNIRPVTLYLGMIEVRNHHLVFGHGLKSELYIQGGPTLSLWILAVSMSLGALLATFDRQSTAILDTMNSPIHKKVWLTSKFTFGLATLIAISLLRTFVVAMVNATSPLPFSFGIVLTSFVMNVMLAIVSFSIVFLAGLLVGNTIAAWILGFLLLNLPLCMGAIIGFYSRTGNTIGLWMYHLEHTLLLNLSPIMYTDYGTNFTEAFNTQTMQNTTLTTSVSHPWMIALISLIVTAMTYVLAGHILARTNAENLSNIFVSKLGFNVAAVSTGFIAGSVTAQILHTAPGIVWVVTGCVCYVGSRVVYRFAIRYGLVGG